MNKRCATQLAKGTIGMDEREAPRVSNMRLREGERNLAMAARSTESKTRRTPMQVQQQGSYLLDRIAPSGA